MPLHDGHVRKAEVTVTDLQGRTYPIKGVRSVIEVSDEENETIIGISFLAETGIKRDPFKWNQVNFDDVKEIRIKPTKR